MTDFTNADDSLNTTARMRTMREIESEPEYAAPMREYTMTSLLNICESHPHPAVRRIAAQMLYTMGARDYIAKQVGK